MRRGKLGLQIIIRDDSHAFVLGCAGVGLPRERVGAAADISIFCAEEMILSRHQIGVGWGIEDGLADDDLVLIIHPKETGIAIFDLRDFIFIFQP